MTKILIVEDNPMNRDMLERRLRRYGFEIVCDRPMPLHVDGEDLGDVDEAVFEAERGAVSVFV